MTAERILLKSWVEHRPEGDFAITYCPQPAGFEHRAYTACWNDTSWEEFDGADFRIGGSVNEAISRVAADFPRGVRP